jgi:hypothetical protein
MTIGVGFVCRDGIVIGADRRLTTSAYTFDERKIFSLTWKNGRALWTYAGDRDIAAALRIEIESRINRSERFSCGALKAAWGKSLQRSLRGIKRFHSLFASGTDEGEYSLWVSGGSKLTEVAECEIIGLADSPLSRYLRGKFLAVPGGLTIQQARLYAVQFISLAEQYDGQFCAGGADIGELSSRFGRIFDAAQTSEWAGELQELEYRWALLFRILANREFDFDIETHDAFVAAIVRFKNWLKG